MHPARRIALHRALAIGASLATAETTAFVERDRTAMQALLGDLGPLAK